LIGKVRSCLQRSGNFTRAFRFLYMKINPSLAQSPFILAVDVGTSSIRALLYDRAGNAVESIEGRVTYEMRLTAGGGVEIDADELVSLTCHAIDQALEQGSQLSAELCGVGLCTFWHSLLGVGSDGQPLTPLYSWNDTRSRFDAHDITERIDVDAAHARTGVIPHSSYQLARLVWLKRTAPELFSGVAHWMTFGEYLLFKLFGQRLASVSMASGTGLFNPNTCAWDLEMLALAGINASQLSPLAADEEALVGLSEAYAKRWPALNRLPWLPAYGDGACSNIGSGCVTVDRVALMVGTSGALRVCFPANGVRIPRGLWCYRANRNYFVMGGALSNGGDVYAWSVKTLNLEVRHTEEQLAKMRPDSHGLTVLPFFSGERSTGWQDNARALIAGMTLSTTPVDILRASLEAVAYRFAAIYQRLREEIAASNRIIASGGGLLKSPVWTQMMADVIGAPVAASAIDEASSRGAALLALQALGQVAELESLPVPCHEVYEPIPEHQALYRDGFARHQRVYELLSETLWKEESLRL
jgi:gluconokinase